MAKDILEELSAQRRKDALEREKSVPYSDVLKLLDKAPAPLDFAAAFAGGAKPTGPARVIAELKKASPSEGLIREDFRPAELAEELESSGATALSVLCEPHRFLGGEDYLRSARRVTRLPILYKDFITTRYQIAEARAAGADAILLIASVLDDASLAALKAHAHNLGMCALVETHTEKEIRRASALECRVIGVNCRDLRSFKTDPSLLPQLIAKIPRGAVRIAESGMHNAAAIREARAAGADGFLVGTALMRAERPGLALESLIEP